MKIRISRIVRIITVLPIIAFCIGFFGASSLKTDALQNKNKEALVSNQTSAKERYTFLLLGEDDAAELSDMIAIVSFDTINQTMCVLQIPRDTYAEYTSAAYRKINAASHILGGGEKLADFLSSNLGIEIDYFLTIDLDVIAKAVDVLGGVEIDVPNDMEYQDPYQNLCIDIKKGKQTLDGEKAKQFIRYRDSYLRGDLGRLDAQKMFISAFIKKLTEKNDVLTLVNLSSIILPEIESNLSYKECLEIIKRIGIPKASNIQFITLPGGDVQGSSGAWYYIMNRSAAYNIVKEYFSPSLLESDFDNNRKFTSFVRDGFNKIYESGNGFEAKIYSAEEINGGIDIETK